jgi:Ala-tRNA(Pro) deacylase
MTIAMAPRSLVEQLERGSVEFELIDHARTESAAAEARILGLSPHEIAKTVILVTPDGFVRAVLPASERLDLQKVRSLLGTSDVHLASEQVLVGAYPEFELGAVPPLAADGDRVLFHRGLCDNEWVVLEAGTHVQSVRLRSSDLVDLSHAELVDLIQD